MIGGTDIFAMVAICINVTCVVIMIYLYFKSNML